MIYTTLSTPLLSEKDQAQVLSAYKADYENLMLKMYAGEALALLRDIVHLKKELDYTLSNKANYFSEENREILYHYSFQLKKLLIANIPVNRQKFLAICHDKLANTPYKRAA